jgi:outer membrane protein TolC
VLAAALVGAGAAWGESFTLDRAIATALANSKGLALADAQVDEAKGRLREVDSGFYPKLEATGGYQYISEVPTITISVPIPAPLGPFEKTIETGKTDNWQAKVQITQPIFLGGAVFFGDRAARAARDAAKLSAGQTRNDLVTQVTAAFNGALAARASEAVVAAALVNAGKHLADVRERFAVGAASRADVLRAEVQVGQIETQLAKARETVNRAGVALRALMGLAPEKSVEVEGDLVFARFVPEGDPHVAAADRPELAALDAQRRAAIELKRSSMAGWFPQVSAQAAYNWQKPWLFEMDGQDYFTVGVGVRVPLFDGLATLGKTDQAKARARQVEVARAAQEDRVRMEVDDALARLFTAEDRVRATRENAERAGQALAMVEDGYRAGAATNLDVLDANLQLLQARLANLQAVYEHATARNDLVRAVGGYAKGE